MLKFYITLLFVATCTANTELIGSFNPYCYKHNAMICDLQNITNSTMFVTNINGSVQLQNVQDVIIDSGVCVDNIKLINVENVKIMDNETSETCKHMELYLYNVQYVYNVSKLVTLMVAVNTKLQHVELYKTMSHVKLYNTTIYILNIVNVMENPLVVGIIDTLLKSLQRLHVTGNTRIFFKNTTIQHMLENALVLGSKNNVLRNVTFPPLDYNAEVALKIGADVTINDINGYVKIKCIENDIFTWTNYSIIIISVCMIISLLFNIIMIIYICFIKKYRSTDTEII